MSSDSMMRNGTAPEYRNLARQLLSHEASMRPVGVGDDSTKHRVFERLLPSLVPLVGKSGFSSLLSRALTLAKRESSSLRQASVGDDGTLHGIPADADEGIEILMAHLIGLLTTFMGETLTLRFLRNAWPEFSALQNGLLERSIYE